MEPSSGYTRFNYHIRVWLSMLITEVKSCREIAKRMGMHHTSISREIEKNGFRHYKAKLYWGCPEKQDTKLSTKYDIKLNGGRNEYEKKV
jgi:IS30 family transposase